MEDQFKISLTGKKLPKIDGSKAKTWQERLAEAERIRKMVYADMLGIGKNETEEINTLPKNN